MAIESIDVANQINEAIAKQHKLLAKSTKQLKDQVAIWRGIAELGEDMDFDKATKKMKEMAKTMDELGNKTDDTKDQVSKTRKALDALGDRKGTVKDLGKAFKSDFIDRFPVMAGAATGFVSGMSSGFQLITKGASAAVGAITTLGSGIFNLGKSIIAIPFKILGGLVSMANSLPGGTAFGEAREAIRKEFGDFGEDLALTTKTMYKSLRGELAETGLTTFRVFGNMAERLNAVREIISGMGNTASLFKDELRDAVSMERVLAFQKGLGISNEQMKTIAVTAKVQGDSLRDVMLEITKASTGFADAFGLSQKVIARGVSEMTADVANFGSMTVHEMAKAAVYVQKLGMEIKDVIGLIDKYDNFEDAAMGAAHLAQAFGANVDALEMMKEQDPSKRLDMLRKSMAMAGVDAERLSRQELKLLASQTGLSEEAAKMAFSLKNQGVSMEELEKQQARNEKSTLTQEEAMMRLSGSIERLVKAGRTDGGFFTQFFKGFERGIKWFSEFRRVLRFIRHDLRIVRWLGIETGRAFVKFFPGVQKMIDGMLEFFNPRRFRQLRNDLSAVFKSLFDGEKDLQTALKDITGIFMDFFSGPGGKKFLEGAMEFGSTIIKFLAQGIDIGLKFIAKAINKLADFIRNPQEVINQIKSGAQSAKNPIMRMLQPLIEAIADNWEPLVEAFTNLWDAAWPKIQDALTKFAKWAVPSLLGTIFAPAVIQAAIGSLTGVVVKGLARGIRNLFNRAFGRGAKEAGEAVAKKPGIFRSMFNKLTKRMSNMGKGLVRGTRNLFNRALGRGASLGAKEAGEAVTKKPGIFKSMFKKLPKLMGKGFKKSMLKFAKIAGPIGMAIGAVLGISEGLDLFYDKIDPKFDDATRKMAAAGTGLIHGFTLGLLPEDLEVRIANALAGLVDTLFKGMEKIFGKQFSDDLKKYLSDWIDLAGSVGDVIFAFFEGDEKKFNDAVMKMMEGLGKTAISGLKFAIFDALPALIKFVMKGLSMLQSAVLNLASSLLKSIKPMLVLAVRQLFGDTFAEGVGYAIDAISWLFENVADFGMKASEFVDDVTKAFSKIPQFFMTLFTEPKKAIKEFTGWISEFSHKWRPGLIWPKGEMAASVRESMNDVKGGVLKTLREMYPDAEKNAREVGEGILGGLTESLAGIKNATAPLQQFIPGSLLDKKKNPFMEEAEKMKKGGLSFSDMSLYKSVKDMDPKEVRKQIDKFRNEVVPLFVGGNGVKPEESLMGAVRKLSTEMSEGDQEAIGKVSIVSGISSKLATLGESAKKIAQSTKDIEANVVRQGMSKLRGVMSDVMSGVMSMSTGIGDSEEFFAAKKNITSVVETVEGIIRKVNAVNEELAEVKPGAVKVRLKNLAKSLGVKNEKFEIKHDKIKMYITLDVNMDAEQIAYAVKKGEWFTLERGPKGPPQRRR